MKKRELKKLLNEKRKDLIEEEQALLDEEIRALDNQDEWKTLSAMVESGEMLEDNINNVVALWLLGIAPKPSQMRHKYELADMADIDLDFSPEGRDRLKAYLSSKYGEENCLSIGTYGTLGVKGSVQEVSRVYGIAPKEYLKVSKLISDEDKDSDEKEIRAKYPQVNEFLENHPEVADTMTKLTGMKKNIGQHAGGFIVSSDSVFDNIPVIKSSKNWVSGWQESGAVKELEALGFIKVDILGLSAVEQIRISVNEINRRYPENDLPEDIYLLPLDDPKVYRFINTLQLDNIFQMESKVFREAVRKIKPQTLQDIANISTLIRPGAACSVDEYADSKMDPHLTPKCLHHVLAHTRGWLTYQEQLMQVLMELGGFTIFEADKVRRLVRKIGKSKTSDENRQEMLDETEKIHKQYLAHATNKIIEEDGWSEKDSKEYAQKQWDGLMGQAKYSFNMPHSYAYSLLGYVQAWIKTYYPLEFWVATLNTIERGQEKHNQSSLGKYINAIQSAGINVRQPDVNKSGVAFEAADDNSIPFALSYIKDVSKGAMTVIENRPYSDWDEFLEKAITHKFHKGIVKGLIFSGAVDFSDDIGARPYKWLLYLTSKGQRTLKDGTVRMSSKIKAEIDEFQKEIPEMFELIQIEYDYCKYSFTGIDHYLKDTRYKTAKTVSDRDLQKKLWVLIGYITDVSKKKSKKSGNEYAIVTISDFRDSISVFGFGANYMTKILGEFQKGQLVKVGVKNDTGWLKFPWEKEYNDKFPIEVIG